MSFEIALETPATALGRSAADLGPAPARPVGLLLEAQRLLRDGAPAAEAACRRVLDHAPEDPDGWNLLGVALARRGAALEGERAHRRALERRPDDPGIWQNLANRLKEQGRAGEAADAFGDAARLAPGRTDLTSARMQALRDAGRHEEAVDVARTLIGATRDAALLASAADVLIGGGALSPALAALQEAIEQCPEQTGWRMQAASLMHRLQQTGPAIQALTELIELEPDLAPAWTLLAACLLQQRDYERLAEVLDRAPAAPSEAANLANLRGMMLVGQGQIEAGLEAMAATRELAPDASVLQMTRTMYLNYHPGLTAEALAEEHRAFGQRFAHAVAPISRRGDEHDPDRPLRIGFLSADFRQHSCAFFTLPILKALDRSAFEPIAYANVARPDPVTAALKELVPTWRDTLHLDDRALAETIADDRVDILIELGGLTKDSRVLACTGRPAPVQISYLGYPNTTGLPQIDYRITDWLADPAGAEEQHSEILIRLPRCFLCYEAPDQAPRIGLPPVVESDAVTFGSFNNLAKVNRRVVELWSELLRQVPRSRLLMKATGTGDPGTQDHFRRTFAEFGIAPDRLHFASYASGWWEHLRVYNEVDVALDTFPYNGTTTTCEALWMGVPVVTLAGDRHAARVGASLLSSVGFTAGVTTSADDYVKTARLLAENPALLAAARRNLRGDLGRSPLGDREDHARTLEMALRAVWRMHCAGERAER